LVVATDAGQSLSEATELLLVTGLGRQAQEQVRSAGPLSVAGLVRDCQTMRLRREFAPEYVPNGRIRSSAASCQSALLCEGGVTWPMSIGLERGATGVTLGCV
jgi:hypothetical protein